MQKTSSQIDQESIVWKSKVPEQGQPTILDKATQETCGENGVLSKIRKASPIASQLGMTPQSCKAGGIPK